MALALAGCARRVPEPSDEAAREEARTEAGAEGELAALRAAMEAVKGDSPRALEGRALTLRLPTYPGGAVHELASDQGSVVLLDVWATWCEPCRDALPAYERLVARYGARGFRAYAVNVDADLQQVRAFLAEAKVGLPILLDRNAAYSEAALKVRVMPTTFLLDRRGVVRFVHEGFSDESLELFQRHIERLLAEAS